MKRATGQRFETYIKMICEAYETQGRAKIRKVDPPTKTFGGGHAMRIIHLANPFLDLVGSWQERSGRAIFLECKSTQIARLPVCCDGGVTANQYEALMSWEAAGAAVGVLWEHADDIRFVSTGMMAANRSEGRASVPWKDAYGIPRGLGFVTHDWLTMLGQIYPCLCPMDEAESETPKPNAEPDEQAAPVL